MTEQRSRIRPLAILAAVVLARLGFGYQFQTVGSLGPTLIPLFGLDYTTFGKLIGAFMLVGTFAALPLGLAGGRFGDRVILTSGLALMVVGAVVSALGGGPGDVALGRAVNSVAPGRAVNYIALGRALCGVGGVAMVVIQGKILADWFQGRGFLLAISVSVGAYPIGVGLGQLTQPPLAEAFGWPAAFLAGGAIQAMSLALFLASFRVPPHNVAHPRRLVLPSGRECLLTALAGLVWASYTSGYTGFLSYAPSLMAGRGESMALTGVVIAIASWGSVPPTVFGAGLANRYGGFRIVLIGTGAVVLGITGSALTDWPILWAVILGVIGQVHPGVIQAIGTLSTRTETRAAGMGIFYCLYYAAGTVVPALCGVAADRAGGPSGALLCAAAVSALGIPAYMLHRRLVSHATMLARA